MTQNGKKRSRSHDMSTWKDIAMDLLENKRDISLDKLLKRGVKQMRKVDSRSEAALTAEFLHTIKCGDVPGYVLNENSGKVEQKMGVKESARREDTELDVGTWRESLKRTDVKTGKFSKEEEEALRQAVINFARENGLSTEDFSWIIGKKEYNNVHGNQIRGIWTKVAQSLPNRTIKSVAASGVRMFHPFANRGAWTSEEDASLRAMVLAVGTKWTQISNTIERTPEACRLRWREIRLGSEKCSGPWSKEEEERLAEAVQKFGRPRSLKGNSTVPKVDSEGNTIMPNRRMILDDINWEAVVAHVKTRSRIQCVTKWYLRLGPTMQDRGEWDKPEDKVLLKALWALRERQNSVMEHEVRWDTLVPGRSADQCKRRWTLMRKSVKHQKDYEFSDLIMELVRTLLPRLLGPQEQDSDITPSKT